MKNRSKYLSIILGLLSLVLSSCVREPLGWDDDSSNGEKVRFEMALNYLSDKQTIQSKAALTPGQEDEIIADRVWVLILDDAATESDRVLKQVPVKAQIIENMKITASINPESSNSWVYVLANVTDAANIYLGSLSAGTTLAQIMNHASMKLTEATSTGLKNPFPMWGKTGNVVAQIRKNSVISETVNLVRAVARIDVVLSPSVLPSNFKIKSVSVINAAKSGWLFQPTPIPAQRLTESVRYNPATELASLNAGTNNAIVGQIYCYENNGMRDASNKNITRLVIEGYYQGKASTSFYGIDIAYMPQSGGSDEKYDIERNKIYTVNINKIDKDGYDSFTLAENSESFNSGVVADVMVTDPYSHNIVSNGKQYMGTTNTHLLVYTKDIVNGAKNILAATISYTTENGWTRGTMTASSGITFVTSGTNTETLEVGSGNTPVIRDVLIHVDKSLTTGTIEVRIGNLSQVIRVVNHRVASAGGDIVDYFVSGASGAGVSSEKDFVVAEIINPSSDNSWFKVSDDISALNSSSLFDKITNPAGTIYLHLAGNIAYNSSLALPRKAQAFVTSKNNEQRYRVHVEQNYLDVYSDARPIKPYTYVGVFHRWNETAERLIRIEGNQSAQGEPGAVTLTGTWVASIVSGDFIMLSTEPSKETLIDEQDPYGDRGVTVWSADDLEANGQFNSGEGRKVVTGEINATTPNIYFKVGMSGKLASYDAQPRYGLIALTYMTGSGATASSQTQFIYVRQGEQADYLMRPSDPVLYTSAYPESLSSYKEPLPTRPLARKMAPYNLRADEPSFTGLKDMDLTKHTFVDYPSKGGDYYFAYGKNVVRKTSSVFIDAGNLPRSWKSVDSENCPYGYRRISDNTKGLTQTVPQSIAKVSESENRQSYWLFPMTSYWRSNFSNQIKGYIADGYFDRRQIVANKNISTSAPTKTYKHCIVRPGGGNSDPEVQHAYWGFLVFNPYNYASVFLPISGTISANGNNDIFFQDEAVFAGYLSTSMYGDNTTSNQSVSVWITNLGWVRGEGADAGFSDVFDNYKTAGVTDSYHVRCIKNEGEAVVGPIEGAVSVEPFVAGSGEEYYNVRIQYNQAGGSLISQLTGAGVDLSKVNTMTVICTQGNSLQSSDYTDLNNMANLSPTLGATNSLHHIILRGAGNQTIPTSAFTSPYWRSITIIDAMTISDGAFNLPPESLLYNLSIGYFINNMSISQASFTGGFVTKNVNLKIRGWALSQANRNVNPPTWLGREWKTINEYK